MGSEAQTAPKPRFLCLHGFRTSGEVMRKQIQKWPESVLEKLDLVFLDAPFPCQGKSDVEGIFDPPYYEWFQFDKDTNEYWNFNECVEYIEDYMIKHGPFHGFLGFSLGAMLSAALTGMQSQGVALTRVPRIKFFIIIGGAILKAPEVAEKAYASPIRCPSLHFLGEKDYLKPSGVELIEECVDPFVIHHPQSHTVPRLHEEGLKTIFKFIERIQAELESPEEEENCI